MNAEALWNQLARAGTALLQSAITGVLSLVLGLVLVVLALVVANVLAWALRAVLLRARLDAVAQRLGVADALGRFGVRQPTSHLVARVTYYVLLVLFARTAADALGLTAISDAIGTFLGYLPNLLAALVLLLAAAVAAPFVGRTVARAAGDSGIDFAPALGTLASSLVLFVLGLMAVGQLAIDTEIVWLFVGTVLAALALAFGLSVGLGTREITRNMLAGFYARKIFRLGEAVEIRGERGVLRSITPTQTLLEQDGRIVSIPNGVFLDETVKQ